jgi:hypothetical protein
MKRLAMAAVLLLALSGCVTVAKVESGDRAVGERMSVKLEGAWNHVSAPGMGPAETWTMEGLPVDQLLLYSGIKDGQKVHADAPMGSKSKEFSFRSSMQPEEIVAMFEGMLTRDGSTFKLEKLEPTTFGGIKGLRFQFSTTRKVDEVQLSGFGYSAVSKGELFAILYMAPRLAFYPRYSPRAEQISRSALVKE